MIRHLRNKIVLQSLGFDVDIKGYVINKETQIREVDIYNNEIIHKKIIGMIGNKFVTDLSQIKLLVNQLI